ncbi:MAG: hypothetical protein ABIB47_04705 [Candidatus Woesearchaeota archaeon]
MKKLKPGRDNKEDRMNFVDYWANYVKNNPDEVWSEQQKVIIDSQIRNARACKLSVGRYLKIKNKG